MFNNKLLIIPEKDGLFFLLGQELLSLWRNV